jgi:signal transduction histidine kinase
MVRLAIADNGAGVPKGFEELIFEPYRRAPTGDRHDIKGFGLGLSLVRQAVALHGGAVTAGRSSSGGAVFTILLPIADSAG